MAAQPWQVFPAEFIAQTLTDFGAETGTQILSGLCQPRVTTFRTNLIKTTSPRLETTLTELGYSLEKVTAINDAFILQEPTLRELETTSPYINGELYVQSLSSMLPAQILHPQPGESVLDLCAAPGSKTTQMAALMHNEGMILANDTSRVRLYKLQANLDRQGVSIVKTRHGLGQIIQQDFPAVFDRVLVDVPCTMEGRMHPKKPKSWMNWGTNQIKILAHRQKQLLRSAIQVTRPGGYIVYSTCTLNKQENEEVISWVLTKLRDRVAIQPINMSLTASVHKNEFGLRILPNQHFEGFFVCLLKKLDIR